MPEQDEKQKGFETPQAAAPFNKKLETQLNGLLKALLIEQTQVRSFAVLIDYQPELKGSKLAECILIGSPTLDLSQGDQVIAGIISLCDKVLHTLSAERTQNHLRQIATLEKQSVAWRQAVDKARSPGQEKVTEGEEHDGERK